jgi:hypothetical protein
VEQAGGHRQSAAYRDQAPRRAGVGNVGYYDPQVTASADGTARAVFPRHIAEVKADSVTPAYPVTRFSRSGSSRLPSRLCKGDGLSCLAKLMPTA